jgi:hypothetical protein
VMTLRNTKRACKEYACGDRALTRC